jgi:leucyl-tRNA synthetase
LVKKLGSDVVRINIIASAENLDDADWRDETIATYTSRINFISKLVKNLKRAKRSEEKKIDLLLQSKIQQHVREATQNYEELKFRSVVQVAFFNFLSDLKDYIERCGGMKNCNQGILSHALSVMVKLLAPILPHLAEEWWHQLGNQTFVSLEAWPEFEESKIDKDILELEQNFKKLVEDVSHVLKLAGQKEKAYFYFVSDKEIEYFEESLKYLKKKFGFKKIFVFKACDEKRYDPQNKAAKAKYGKPGIYLE